jgi:hypothetical protein
MDEKKAVCIFCGEITSDWWFYDGRVDLCRCKSCLDAGVSSTFAEDEFYKSLSREIFLPAFFERVPSL